MNYSNMIEEKNLKKTFIIATLVSTLVGTFTASMNLHDKVQEKRQAKKQAARDTTQDDKIKQLNEKIDKLQTRDSSEDRDNKRSKSRDGPRRIEGPRRKSIGWREDDDGFDESVQRSTAMIQREYEQNFSRFGGKFAVGDVITENKLQSQIIQLQQTVINVLQDALYNDRPLTKADINKLITAQQAAREGSLDALRGQYNRMLEAPAPTQRSIAPSVTPPPRRLTMGHRRTSSLPPPRRAATAPASPLPPLFCRYSQDLQDTRKPLGGAFDRGGDRHCPACDVRIPVDSQDYWVLETRTAVTVVNGHGQKDVTEMRSFQMSPRFVIKCHTEEGEFACVLCNQNRDVDVICDNVDMLVKHLGRVHGASEFEKEVDMSEL